MFNLFFNVNIFPRIFNLKERNCEQLRQNSLHAGYMDHDGFEYISHMGKGGDKGWNCCAT